MPNAPKIVPLKPRHTPPPRRTTAERGYGSAHRRRRAAHLARHPVCQVCNEAWSTDLHHAIPKTFLAHALRTAGMARSLF
jgi:hypothetical protein